MKTEAERQLAKLVSMPTITEDTLASAIAIDYVADYLAARGMHLYRYQWHGHSALFATSRVCPDMRVGVLLSGHLDVVPAEEEQFTLREEDGRLYGRGTFDMKFAIAAYMQLVDELQGKLQDYDFGILLITDEEYGGRTGHNGSEEFLKLGWRANVALLPDSAAAGWNIEERAKASWRFELVAAGKAVHGSRPWEGESASFKLVRMLHDLREYFIDHGPDTETLNVGMIHGGKAFNQVPELMTASAEIRIVNDENYPRLVKVIQDLGAKYDVQYVERVVNKIAHADMNDPFVRAYADSVEKITGRRPKPVISAGGSDAPHFMDAGVPHIISCPDGSGHHGRDEWIDRKQFNQFVPILIDYLGKHARVAPAKKPNKPLHLANK
jgi:succinyl-diaminopimelate desuccinylase